MNKIKTLPILAIAAALWLAAPRQSFATSGYFQGFETDTSGWTDFGNPIQRVMSGPAAPAPSSGAYYGEAHNTHDVAEPGYGSAGYSFYGGSDSTYNGSFFQSIDVYINANWTAPSNASVPGFWIDMTPYHADPNNFGAEHNFQVYATGSQVNIGVDGGGNVLSLTNSGWYTFQMTYTRGANPTDPVITGMNIYLGGVLLSSTTVFANSPGGPFESQDLRGNGYVWLTEWQNGFASDIVGIDNLRTGPLGVPDSGATAMMLGLGFFVIAGFGRYRRAAKA